MIETQEPFSERVMVPMQKSLLAEIEDFRFEARCRSQADAIRELIRAGLNSWQLKQKGSERRRAAKGESAS